jgi:Fic family protein
MWIYNQPNWPEFYWDSKALSSLLAMARFKQGHLLGRMESIGFELKQEASLSMLTQDVLNSAAVEGEKLNQQEVRSSVARHLGISISHAVHVGRKVDGMVEMMIDATQHFLKPLTAERLFDWHAALFPTGRSGMHPIHVGQWRSDLSGPMQVVSGPLGRETVHFQAPPAEKLATEMDQYLIWFDSDSRMDPILKAGLAHFWFVTLHPFDDGNGRIARAIADMALARADGVPQRFYSMSTQIEVERKDYYLQLETHQRGKLDVTGWLDWFLSCLSRAIDQADSKVDFVLQKSRFWSGINQNPVNERQRFILNLMMDEHFKGFMNTSKYAKLAKCSTDTALRDIQDLKQRGVFIQNPAKGRSTSYRLHIE